MLQLSKSIQIKCMIIQYNTVYLNNLFIRYYPPHIMGSSSRSCISYFNVIWNNHDPTPTANKEQKISWYLKMIMATFNDNHVTPHYLFYLYRVANGNPFTIPQLKTLLASFIYSPNSGENQNQVCDCTPKFGNIFYHLKYKYCYDHQ